LSFIT